MRRALAAAAAGLVLAAGAAQAAGTQHRLTLADGKQVSYTLRRLAAQPPQKPSPAKGAPASAPAAAARLIGDLARGEIQRAALLSNAPKQRYALLREAYADWTPKDFARVYGRYFTAPNGMVAEATIGAHHLVIWRLQDIHYLAGYFFVDVGGRTYLDDRPGPVRAQLEQVLEAVRAGKLQLP